MTHDDHEHGHTDAHGHEPHAAPHAPVEEPEPQGHYQVLANAVRELLIEKGYFTPDQLRGWIEKIDERGPALGARIVARAWTDPAFKRRLLDDGKSACGELGIDINVANLMVEKGILTREEIDRRMRELRDHSASVPAQ